ncbi:MAG: hypothetical protein IJQ31_11195 [Thermoguttaceae bacterium]|nr:hypothetical protein [Thermoguttaceae bacterium]
MDVETRIIKCVQTFAPAVQGERGRYTLYRAAKYLVKKYDLTPEQVFGYLWEFYNPRCIPPWDDSEKRDFINQCKSAWKKAPADRGRLLERGERSQAVKAPALSLVRSDSGSGTRSGSRGSEILIPYDDGPARSKRWYEGKREIWNVTYGYYSPGVFLNVPSPKSKYRAFYLFDYRNKSGDPYMLIKRIEMKELTANGKPKKSCLAYHWDAMKGGYISGGGGLASIPWRLPDLEKAESVILVEGEKAAFRLNRFLERWFDETEILTTCFPNGAGAWSDDRKRFFQGKTVFVWPDNDSAGFEYARRAADSLRSVTCNVKALKFYPDRFPQKADAVEVLEDFQERTNWGEIEARDLEGLIQEMFYKEK